MTNQYEKTFLNLLERVAVLEEKMEAVEKKEVKSNLKEVHAMDTNQSVAGSTFNKNTLIKELKNEMDSLGIEVNKASISDGGGVITKYGDNDSRKVMLRRSRNYSAKGYEWRGWHTIKAADVDLFDGFILSIENEGRLHFFIFSKKDFNTVLKQKQTDSNGIYHFYLNKEQDGKTTDDREDDIINMDKYYNNWEALKH